MYINYVISLCSEFNVVSTYIKFRQSDIEELPVYIGQKWPSESLELTCWADDDSLNIEIIGSMVGAVRRKYQVFLFFCGAILKYLSFQSLLAIAFKVCSQMIVIMIVLRTT